MTKCLGSFSNKTPYTFIWQPTESTLTYHSELALKTLTLRHHFDTAGRSWDDHACERPIVLGGGRDRRAINSFPESAFGELHGMIGTNSRIICRSSHFPTRMPSRSGDHSIHDCRFDELLPQPRTIDGS
jgi:hypothetical protein